MDKNQKYSDVSVVVATLNEEKGVGPTLEELQTVLEGARLIVVDGNSIDKTVEIAKKMGADVSLQNGHGKGDAIFQGIKQLGSNMRYVVFIDADFTYPAEYVPKMIDILTRKSDVGMVLGNRFNGEHNFAKATTNVFYTGNRMLAFVQYLLNDVRLDDPLSGLRVVKREILENWIPKSKGFDIEVELNFLIDRRGFQTVEIPIEYRKRVGQKKLKLRHGLTILKRIIGLSFS